MNMNIIEISITDEELTRWQAYADGTRDGDFAGMIADAVNAEIGGFVGNLSDETWEQICSRAPSFRQVFAAERESRISPEQWATIMARAEASAKSKRKAKPKRTTKRTAKKARAK